MLIRRFDGIKLYPNDILIKQREDVTIVCHEDQSVIDGVRANVHRYHAKQKDGILYAAQLDDTNSARYVDGQPALVSNVEVGDTLVYIPGFYATLRIQRGDISVYRFSTEAINSRSFKFGDVFIGAYGGDFTNERLNSISHPASPAATWRTKTQIENMAKAKGTGYSAVTLAEHNLVGLLYVAIHRNTDCKGTLGAGAATSDRPCGTSTQVGMKESAPGDAYTSFLGIENWWGGRYEVVGDIVANNGTIDGIYHVTERDGSVREIQSIAPTSQWMYPRKMILGERFDIVADPVCYAGEITSGHGWHSEQYMRNEADRAVMRGGFMADISSGFAFLAARFSDAEIGTFNTMTGRLAYKGDYEFVGVDSYREMFDPDWAPPVVAEEYDVSDAPDGAYIYTSGNKLMNLAAYQQSGKTLDDVWGIAVLDGNLRFCFDPRIKDRLQMNVSRPVVVPYLKAYGENDTDPGLRTSWYIMHFDSWKHDKTPSIWFALNAGFKHGEQGYLPSYGEALSMKKNQDDIADIITGINLEIPSPLYHTSTFPQDYEQNYVNVMQSGFGGYITMGTTAMTTVCTSLPVCPLMDHDRDYFVLYQKADYVPGGETSIKPTKHGITDYITQNSHRYLCKYVNGVMNICQLDDNNSNFFHDGTPSDLTGAQGDVMMMMPKFYARTRSLANNYDTIKFGYVQKDYQENMPQYGGRLIGVYQSSMVDGVIRSVSGQPVLSGISRSQFDAYAKQRGDGFSLLIHQDCDIIALLFILKYEGFDWETEIGSGAYVENSVTGVTDSMGMTDGVGSGGRINIMGLEDLWGNGYEYIGNANYNREGDFTDFIYNIDNDGGTYTTMFDASSYEKNRLIFSDLIAMSNYKDIDWISYDTFCTYPSGIPSDSPYGIKCQYMFSDKKNMAVARGGCNDGLGNGYGLAYMNTMFGVDETGDARNRSRISYKGDINIIENVQDFLNL